MAERPHRVVIRTTPDHFATISGIAAERSSSLSTMLRELLRLGIEAWKRSLLRDVPHHGLTYTGPCTKLFQLRMPNELFQNLEDVVDDMEYTRTDLYLRMIELGRENLDVKNDSCS